jgi:hypothetical protein
MDIAYWSLALSLSFFIFVMMSTILSIIVTDVNTIARIAAAITTCSPPFLYFNYINELDQGQEKIQKNMVI